MSNKDDEFRPRLGRIRARGGRASKRYLGKLYERIEKTKPGAFAKRSGGRFTGARIGRGSGVAAAFANGKHPFAKFRSRRVAVKIRSVRMGANGLPKARAHLKYLQRDGADKEGNPGKLYGPMCDVVNEDTFLEEGRGDRHQFRIILSPEEAGELESLKSFTRDVMAAAERDLGTKLDWAAVNHYDTDHPHAHLVLRGRADDGKDLVIARNYITHGFRRRAEELATLELGPRRDLEIANARFRETTAERFTNLDRELENMAENGGIELGRPRSVYDRFRLKLFAARLKALEKMNLASRDRDGWKLSSSLEETLKEAGRRGDIIRSMDRAMGDKFSPANLRDFSHDFVGEKLVGRVTGSGAEDDAHDQRFLALDGVDGNQWHVSIDVKPGAMPPVGAVVTIRKQDGAPRKSDRTIDAVARRNGGVYSDDLHNRADPNSSPEYRLAHKRRLEALRCAGLVDRQADGSWKIPADFLDRAASFESAKSGAVLRVLSWAGVECLATAPAQTFLDDLIEQKSSIETVRFGFGGELESAVAQRRRWLMSKGLAQEEAGATSIDRQQLGEMERKELVEIGKRLAARLGKSFVDRRDSVYVSGIYRGPHDSAVGRYAVIEKSKEFTLVPWRDALEVRRGMEVSGVLQRGRVTWDFGKKRGGLVR